MPLQQPLKHSIDTNLIENPSACMPCVPEVQTEPTDAFKLDSSTTAGAKSSSPKLQDSSIENQSIEPEQLPAVQPELALPTHSPLDPKTEAVLSAESVAIPDSQQQEQEHNDIYILKPLLWKDTKTGEKKRLCIITQNNNGPCPLISLCNVLILRGDIIIHSDLTTIRNERLLELLGDYLLRRSARDSSTSRTSEQLTFEHTMDDILVAIPMLQFGLDVNVHFNSVLGFELTSALCLFDMFGIRLVHGWVCDPDEQPAYTIVAQKYKSYNRAVETIIAGDTAGVTLAELHNSEEMRSSTLPGNEPMLLELTRRCADLETMVTDGLTCSQFLSANATQLTHYGLQLIEATIAPGELCVFFRNNHFSTMYKHPEQGLFVLMTDQGFAKETGIVWESMARVDGNTEFLDELFQIYRPGSSVNLPLGNFSTDMASFPSDDRDHALALSLQHEEECRHREFVQQQSLMATASSASDNNQNSNSRPSQRPHGAREHYQKQSQKSNCIVQ
ncbi:hypothetical protein MT418_005198 [Batrachochytrium dendrobatidis]